MNFRQLESFVAVIREGSFTAAARALFVTQPSVSHQVSLLEQELGQELIKRDGREMTLTAAGEVCYKKAVELIAGRDELKQTLVHYEGSHELHGLLKLGASTLPSRYLVAPWLAAFIKQYPQISFDLQTADSSSVIKSVLDSEVELGLVGYASDHKSLSFTPLLSDRLCLIAPCRASWLTEENALLDDGSTIPYLEREIGSGTRQAGLDFLKTQPKLKQRLRTIAHLASNDALVAAVSHGLGMALVSEISVKSALDCEKVVRVKDLQPESIRQFYLVRRKNAELSCLASAFMDFICDLTAEECSDE